MRSKVVLVVEDEWLIREVLVEILTNAGFETLEAERGEYAFTMLEQDALAVDVLFTDIRMPGNMDGLELATRVSMLWPRVAIVVASGNQKPLRTEMPPGSLFLPKPYSFRELPGQLGAFLGQVAEPC